MQKHYILTLDPTAKYEWDRCTLRDPMTAARPDLAELVRDAVGEASGNYLVAIKLDVQVLERTPIVTEDMPPVAYRHHPEERPVAPVDRSGDRPAAVRFRDGEIPKRVVEAPRPVEVPSPTPNHHLAAV
ncbi:hypothetical protein OOK60_16915 [Trichothermofontia sichuanensis B231]|uniref:hypothetical protein n=1 Tax=Trichothermofontia sichuanensis TaxID=3045816 RepID=UPI0022454690|nr:hypothetical protein [Trichothermofontia sichuanensis]UZQ54143.1 hypothetical protein OOK60_16915 [Trichothermofontia sichuanensis B231]